MVGHTHDVVDQMFGVFAETLRNTNTPTISSLCEALRLGGKLLPVEMFDDIYNFTEMISFDQCYEIHGIKETQTWCIEKDNDGNSCAR